MRFKLQLIVLFFFSMLLLPQHSFARQQVKTINVKDFQAKGDGMSDDSKAIQAAINSAAAGDTVFIPEGIYLVKIIGLRSGVNIKSIGTLRQQVSSMEEFTNAKQNSTTPLIRGKDVSNIHLSVKLESKNEGIYITGSKNITISHSDLMGDATKLRSFAGILLFRCEGVTINRTKVAHYGTTRIATHTYQPGTGIRIMESKNVTVKDSDIQYNGENGVFMHQSPDVSVINTSFRFNGMSAIQVAFGNTGVERNYTFLNNLMEYNASDAIDINNRSPKGFWDINCLIKHNVSRNNGFVNGKSTPDGSGIATLINVSGVRMISNSAQKNNRPALYIESCGDIYAEKNTADNQVEIVLGLELLTMLSNEMGNINLLANVKAKKILLEKNVFRNISMPNDVQVDSLLVLKNQFTHGMFNINMTGNVVFAENKITSRAENVGFLIVKANSLKLEKNDITTFNSSALHVQRAATNITISDNTIQSVNSCIVDEGAEGLRITGNKLISLEGGKSRNTLVSNNPRSLFLAKNEHLGTGKNAALLFKGAGTAYVDGELFTQGVADYGDIQLTKK